MVIITGTIIVVSFIFDRSLSIKPSFIISSFFFLQVQIGSAILSDQVFSTLLEPWEYFFVIHGYSIVALLSSLMFFRKQYRIIFHRIINRSITKREIVPKVFYLIIPALMIAAWYLSVVPISSTGLYVSIFDPQLSDIAREKAFSALKAPALKYGYYVMSIVLAPMSAIMMFMLIVRTTYEKVDFSWKLIAILSIFFLTILVSLYGARGPSAMLVVAMFYTIYLRRGAPIHPIRILFIVAIVLLMPAMISMFKNADIISWKELGIAFLNIIDRVFVRGAVPNIWYIDHIQSSGLWGISGIPKLAVLVGEPPLNVANLISLAYDRYSLPEGSANCAYVTQYYSFFGFLGCVISLVAILVIDSIVYLYKFMRPIQLLPVIGALIIPFSNLSFSQISTVLISKGLLAILITGFIILKLPSIRIRPITTSQTRRGYLNSMEQPYAQ